MSRRPLVLLLALAAACSGDPTAADSAGTLALATAGGLEASLELAPEQVAPGGEFTVRYALRNTAPDTARLTLGCPALALFAVRTAAGATVDGSGDLPSGCLGVIASLQLAPGRDTVLVARGRAVALTYPPLAQPTLAAGTYSVVALPTTMWRGESVVRLPELSRRLVVR